MQPGLLHSMLVLLKFQCVLKDWQIVVTHFPPLPGAERGSVARTILCGATLCFASGGAWTSGNQSAKNTVTALDRSP